MCFDMWFIKHPIWMQIDAEKNNAGQFLPNHEQLRDRYRRVVEKRMSLRRGQKRLFQVWLASMSKAQQQPM